MANSCSLDKEKLVDKICFKKLLSSLSEALPLLAKYRRILRSYCTYHMPSQFTMYFFEEKTKKVLLEMIHCFSSRYRFKMRI